MRNLNLNFNKPLKEIPCGRDLEIIFKTGFNLSLAKFQYYVSFIDL